MTENLFKKAERQATPLKIALIGPSGSFKTRSALLLARGIVGEEGKIAVLDTENGRASLYSHVTDFDVLDVGPPFKTEKYEAAIAMAQAHKYGAIVLDSISHAWALSGGLLEQKDELDLVSKNQYGNWGPISKKHNNFIQAMMQSPIDLIATMRTKMGYEQQGGKVVKLGLEPVQRDGMEYEFAIVFEGDQQTHMALATKDMTELFKDEPPFLITVETGEMLRKWRDEGGEYIQYITTKTKSDVSRALKALEWGKDEWLERCGPILAELGVAGLKKMSDLTDEQGGLLYEKLKAKYKETNR